MEANNSQTKRKPKGNKPRNYNEGEDRENMLKAISYWNNNCLDEISGNVLRKADGKLNSVEEVANQFNVNPICLRNRLKHKIDINARIGKKRLFTDEEEIQMTEYVIIMSRLGFALNSFEMISLFKQYAKSLNKPDLDNKITKGYLQKYFIRRKDLLSIRKANLLEPKRVKATKRETITDFVDNLLKEEREKCGLDDNEFKHILYNMDETGISTFSKSYKVWCQKGSDANIRESTDKYDSNTLIICGSAGGDLLSPMVIFRSPEVRQEWKHWELAKYKCSKSGYSNNDIFRDWLREVFIPETNKLRPQNYRGSIILIIDGTHVNLESITIAIKHKIVMLKLLAHLTHLIQPLDRVFFGCLKSEWNSVLSSNRDLFRNQVPKEIFITLLKLLWDRCEHKFKDWLEGGFSRTGLHPLNSNKIPDSDFEISIPEDWKNIETTQKVFKELSNITTDPSQSQSFFMDKIKGVILSQTPPDPENRPTDELRFKRGTPFGANLNKKAKVLKEKTNIKANNKKYSRLSKEETKKFRSHCFICFTQKTGLFFQCSNCNQWFHHLCYPSLKNLSESEKKVSPQRQARQKEWNKCMEKWVNGMKRMEYTVVNGQPVWVDNKGFNPFFMAKEVSRLTVERDLLKEENEKLKSENEKLRQLVVNQI